MPSRLITFLIPQYSKIKTFNNCLRPENYLFTVPRSECKLLCDGKAPRRPPVFSVFCFYPDAAKAGCPRLGQGYLVETVVPGRMHFKADHVIPHGGENGTEERLDHDGVILQNFLDFLHLDPA